MHPLKSRAKVKLSWLFGRLRTQSSLILGHKKGFKVLEK